MVGLVDADFSHTPRPKVGSTPWLWWVLDGIAVLDSEAEGGGTSELCNNFGRYDKLGGTRRCITHSSFRGGISSMALPDREVGGSDGEVDRSTR